MYVVAMYFANQTSAPYCHPNQTMYVHSLVQSTASTNPGTNTTYYEQ